MKAKNQSWDQKCQKLGHRRLEDYHRHFKQVFARRTRAAKLEKKKGSCIKERIGEEFCFSET